MCRHRNRAMVPEMCIPLVSETTPDETVSSPSVDLSGGREKSMSSIEIEEKDAREQLQDQQDSRAVTGLPDAELITEVSPSSFYCSVFHFYDLLWTRVLLCNGTMCIANHSRSARGTDRHKDRFSIHRNFLKKRTQATSAGAYELYF